MVLFGTILMYFIRSFLNIIQLSNLFGNYLFITNIITLLVQQIYQKRVQPTHALFYFLTQAYLISIMQGEGSIQLIVLFNTADIVLTICLFHTSVISDKGVLCNTFM